MTGRKLTELSSDRYAHAVSSAETASEPSPVAREGAGRGPLSGVSVLDLSNVGPGARCTRILSDLGATVTRIAPPPRDGSQRIEAPFYLYGAGRGMRRVTIDLKDDRGREVFLRLAAVADVVIESFRPGAAARLGISHEDVARVNPGIVYCSISGYGQTGPAARWPGHDLNYVATAGMLATTQPRPDGGPALPGLTVADTAGGGMQAALAVLAALVRRATASEGTYLDVSMTEGVLYLMSLHVDEFLATGREPSFGTSTTIGRYACYDVYRARDGGWLAVGALESGFFANLCRALGCEGVDPPPVRRRAPGRRAPGVPSGLRDP
ncbi:MAG: CoA transferase [Acidimicrobiia bacterium]|nr:CoA transferase [Acidimicrobiia bacterium]